MRKEIKEEGEKKGSYYIRRDIRKFNWDIRSCNWNFKGDWYFKEINCWGELIN